MAVITWPDYRVASMRWMKAAQSVVFSSIFGKQALEGSAPLWEVDLQGVSEDRATARQVQALIESLNGYTNQLELWNVEQPAPAGTMRGTMTLSSSAAQGAGSLVITAGAGQASKTLLAGDLLGIGSGLTQQVVRATANATANASGVITVSIGTPLRNAFSAGAAVTWDKPKALFRQKSLSNGIDFQPEGGQPWSLSLVEDWRA
jgi:hypothetical protein